MTYIVACTTEVYGERLLLRLETEIYSVPLKAFRVADDKLEASAPDPTVTSTVRSVHQIGLRLEKQMIRIRELEAMLRAAGLPTEHPPKPDVKAPDKPIHDYKPLDHGPRDNDAAAPEYRR